MSKNKKVVIGALIAVAVIAMVPLFALKGAEFGGSDDAGSKMVEQISGSTYEPWFKPVLEQLIGGELPSEVESLFFCLQTGLGVGVVAFGFGYLVARKKYAPKDGPGEKKLPEDQKPPARKNDQKAA